jgi:hypothetical protein
MRTRRGDTLRRLCENTQEDAAAGQQLRQRLKQRLRRLRLSMRRQRLLRLRQWRSSVTPTISSIPFRVLSTPLPPLSGTTNHRSRAAKTAVYRRGGSRRLAPPLRGDGQHRYGRPSAALGLVVGRFAPYESGNLFGEVRFPGTPGNKGKRKGRGCYAPAPSPRYSNVYGSGTKASDET